MCIRDRYWHGQGHEAGRERRPEPPPDSTSEDVDGSSSEGPRRNRPRAADDRRGRQRRRPARDHFFQGNEAGQWQYRTPEEARRAASPPTSPELVRRGTRDFSPRTLTAVGNPRLVPPTLGNRPRDEEVEYRPEGTEASYGTARPRELIVPSRFPPTALSRAAEQEQTVYDEPLSFRLPPGPPQHQSTPGEEDELFHSLAASADPDLTN